MHRVPDQWTVSIWGMRSAVSVGGHIFEVETSHWSGSEVYRIDGLEVRRLRNLGWHADQRFELGAGTVRVVGRWYPLLPVEVRVDDQVVIDELFPALAWIRVVLATVVGPLMMLLGASIVWDLVRILLAVHPAG